MTGLTDLNLEHNRLSSVRAARRSARDALPPPAALAAEPRRSGFARRLHGRAVIFRIRVCARAVLREGLAGEQANRGADGADQRQPRAQHAEFPPADDVRCPLLRPLIVSKQNISL